MLLNMKRQSDIDSKIVDIFDIISEISKYLEISQII